VGLGLDVTLEGVAVDEMFPKKMRLNVTIVTSTSDLQSLIYLVVQ
jgi:hypothetical protein